MRPDRQARASTAASMTDVKAPERTAIVQPARASCFQELSLLLLPGPSMALTDRSLVVAGEYRYKLKANATRVSTAVQVLYDAFHLRRQDIGNAF